MSFLQLLLLPAICWTTQFGLLWELAQRCGETFCFLLFFFACMFRGGS